MSKLFIISGPSGAGKGTLVNLIMERFNDIFLSILYFLNPYFLKAPVWKVFQNFLRKKHEIEASHSSC